MKKDRYIYPAVFDYSPDGISVSFPDLPGALTCGDDDEDALRMAKECLALYLYDSEESDEVIPEPTRAVDVSVESSQTVVLVEAWMPPFRDEMAEKAVKKTLTIPKWLNDVAEENNVNFSRVLQDALKSYLGVKERKKA